MSDELQIDDAITTEALSQEEESSSVSIERRTDYRIYEYQALRTELLDRIKIRQQILFAVGFAFVAIISLHLNLSAREPTPDLPVVTVYPILGMFMCALVG